MAEWNLPVIHSDRDAGVITSDEFVLGGGNKFLGQSADYWANCGSTLSISRAASADEFRIRVSVILRSVEGDSTAVNIQSSFSAYQKGAIGADRTTCASRGRLEAQLIDELRRRLGS